MKRNLFCLLTMLMLLFPLLWAQGQSRIDGYVTDDLDGRPVAKAEIKLEPGGRGAVSDEKGYFVIEGLSAGKYLVQVSHIIYYTWRKDVVIKDGAPTLNIKMVPRIYELQGVEVKENYSRPIPYVRTQVDREQIELVASRDIGDFMRSIPNVSGIRKGGGNIDPVVRGMKFDQLIVQMNGGQRIEGGCPNRMDPTTSHIEMEDIESIEILKGPYALRYGPVFGGIVNLKTISPKPYPGFQVHVKGLKGYETNWNGNKEHIELLGGNDRVYFALTGNRLHYGNYFDGNGNRVFSEINRFGYAGRVGFRPLKKHEAIITYAESYARNIMFPALPMDERIDNTLIMGFDYTIKDLTPVVNNLQFKLYSSDVYHEMDNFQRSGGDSMAVIAAVDATKWGYRLEAGLNFGAHRVFLGTDYDNTFKDGLRTKDLFMNKAPSFATNGAFVIKPEQLWHNASIENQGFFAEYRYKINKLEFMLAGRYDMNKAVCDSIAFLGMKMPNGTTPVFLDIKDTDSKFGNISFSGGVTYALTEEMTASLMAGRGTRSPNMLERFIIKLPVGYDNYEYMGNPNLEPETNNQVDLSFRYKNKVVGMVEAGVFYSRIENYISGVPMLVDPMNFYTRPFTMNAYGVKEFSNTGGATMYGWELVYKTPENKWWGGSVMLATTIGRLDSSLAPIYGDTVINAFNVTGYNKVTDDYMPEIPPLEAKIQVYAKLFNGVLIPRLSWRWVAEQKNASFSYGEFSTPSFNLIDFGIQYNHSRYFTLNAGVNNVLDQAYYEHLNRRVMGSLDKLYEPGRVFFASLIFNI